MIVEVTEANNSFKSEDNNYILKFNKSSSKLFSDRNINTINIHTFPIDSKVLSLRLSDNDIYKLIDNIEYYITEYNDVILTLSNGDTDCKKYMIGIRSTDYFSIESPDIFPYNHYMTIYSYSNEMMIKILSFRITTNGLLSLLDKLYFFYNDYIEM